jgi:hypothetical protein
VRTFTVTEEGAAGRHVPASIFVDMVDCRRRGHSRIVPVACLLCLVDRDKLGDDTLTGVGVRNLIYTCVIIDETIKHELVTGWAHQILCILGIPTLSLPSADQMSSRSERRSTGK